MGPVARPHPVADRERHDPDRELDCSHYDDCLDVAVRSRWDGFTCRECHLRSSALPVIDSAPAPISPPQPRGCGVRTGLRARLLELLKKGDEARAWTIGELANAVNEEEPLVGSALAALVREGRIRRVGKGLYEA